jgi:hypothetical protein
MVKSYTVSPASVLQGNEYDVSIISTNCQPDELIRAGVGAPAGSGIHVLSVNNTNECILIARISVAGDAPIEKPTLWITQGQAIVGTATVEVKQFSRPASASSIAAPPESATVATRPRTVGGTPRVEVFGGYSYVNGDFPDVKRFNANGFNSSLVGNINRFFGAELDFSGHYATFFDVSVPGILSASIKTRAYTALAGPRFTARYGRGTAFFHALFGASHGTTEAKGAIPILGLAGSLRISDTTFAMALGGGFDLNLNRNVAIRLGQVDYILTRFREPERITQNNFRVSTGMVFRFGNADGSLPKH